MTLVGEVFYLTQLQSQYLTVQEEHPNSFNLRLPPFITESIRAAALLWDVHWAIPC